MYKKKVDLNQSEIVHGLRRYGASVFCAHKVGGDFPDLVVGYRNKNYLFEVKSGKSGLTQGQKDFHEAWGGSIHTVRNVDEAIAILTEDIDQ